MCSCASSSAAEPATSAPTPSSSSSRPVTRSLVVDNFANAKPTVVNRLEALTGQAPDGALVRPARPRQDRAPVRARADRRGDPLRRAQGRRRERRDAAGVLREQPRLDVLAGARDAAARRAQAGLLSRRPRSTARNAPVPMHRGPADLGDQPLRLDQGDDRADPARRRRRRPDAGGSPCCATSTRSAPTASGTIGEDPQGIPNNLMPFIAQVAVGRREKLLVFGDDYPTPDGTGAARLHPRRGPRRRPRRGAEPSWPRTDEPVSTWNLGTGHGTSVLEVLHAFEQRRAAASCPTRSSADAPVTSRRRTPTRHGRRPSSAGGRPARSTTCAPTRGAGRAEPARLPRRLSAAQRTRSGRPTTMSVMLARDCVPGAR